MNLTVARTPDGCTVNGWYPNYGCSKYTLEDGDTVEWRYTCNLGRDVGDQYYD